MIQTRKATDQKPGTTLTTEKKHREEVKSEGPASKNQNAVRGYPENLGLKRTQLGLQYSFHENIGPCSSPRTWNSH